MSQTMAMISLLPLLPLLNHHHRTRPIFISSSKSHLSIINSVAQFPKSTLPLPNRHKPFSSSLFHHFSYSKRAYLRLSAISEGEIPSETAIQDAQQIVSENGDLGPSIVAFLLGVAFVGLTIVTIGVIYIAVTDFLQKREREKFEKEEAAKKKKGGKKRVVRAKTGPRGFGQKIEEEEEVE